MRGYRNPRIENINYHIVNGRRRPLKRNFFYNHVFKYFLERASACCARWSPTIYNEHRSIRIVFDEIKDFEYHQTRAYLKYIRPRRHTGFYPNNKRQIDWRVVNPDHLEAKKPKNEPLLHIADWVASAVYASIDVDQMKYIYPEFLSVISKKFIALEKQVRDNGFCLLPTNFTGPLTAEQKQTLRIFGYKF